MIAVGRAGGKPWLAVEFNTLCDIDSFSLLLCGIATTPSSGKMSITYSSKRIVKWILWMINHNQ